jgi:hypothetical protein
MTKIYEEAKGFQFPAMHMGNNPQSITLCAVPSGDLGIYQEISVTSAIGDKCIGNVLIGLNEEGELRVLVTTGGDGDEEPQWAIFPQRPSSKSIEEF